jgi:hypothetical protein
MTDCLGMVIVDHKKRFTEAEVINWGFRKAGWSKRWTHSTMPENLLSF